MQMGPGQILTSASMAGGALIVWLLAAAAYAWRWQALHNMPCSAPRTTFQAAPGWRISGLLLVLLSLSSLLIVLGIPENNIQPGDWLIALLIGMFLPGLGALSGLSLWMIKIHCCENGIRAWSAWGGPEFIPWSALQRVTTSGAMQSYKLIGDRKTVHVPLMIENPERFLTLVRQHAPQAQHDPEIDSPTDQIMETSHYRGLNRAAPWIALVSGCMVLASLTALPPNPKGLMFSLSAGLALMLDPASRNLFPHRSALVKNLTRFFGLAAFGVLSQIAQRQYHIDTVDDAYTGLLTLMQSLGSAIFAASGLVLLSRRFANQ